MYKRRVLVLLGFSFLSVIGYSWLRLQQNHNRKAPIYLSDTSDLKKVENSHALVSTGNFVKKNWTQQQQKKVVKQNWIQQQQENVVKKHWTQQQLEKIIKQVATRQLKPDDKSCQVDYMTSSVPVEQRKKVIFYMGDLWEGMGQILQFYGCEYSGCIYQTCDDVSYAPLADALLFAQDSRHISLTVPAEVRQRQLWFAYAVESPAYERYQWNKAINDFNGTMTYLHNSTPSSFPYGFTLPLNRPRGNVPSTLNYAINKTKGAYAYVSNCNSQFYDRLGMMRRLSRYIDIDIYGHCTGKTPCPNRFDFACEAKLHSQYRFHLAFENSLCTEYITEKFYKSLQSDGYYIPVALGGLGMNEYNRVAPPNSFIHVYNFTSMEQLGLYLKHLMTDDAAYNKYHEWRQRFKISMWASRERICKLCETLQHPETLVANVKRRFADEWNRPENCRSYTGL